MGRNRANVLRSVHQTLENHEPLRAYLRHVKGATTIRDGARILGDDIRIDDLPIPTIILSFAGGDAIAPGREDPTWLLDATIYAGTIYQLADVLDLVEEVGSSWVRDNTLPQPLSRFRVTGHERLDAVGPAGRLLAVRVNLEVTWIST